MVVHKIIKKDGDKITTRGEANLVADEPIGAEAVMGKVVLTLPNVGVVVNAICSPIGVIFIILAVVLIAEIVFLHQREKANRIEEINEIIKLGE